MQDVLDEDSEMGDWLIERDSKLGVVLHDRLMTDAALGAAPIKTEHSYSLHSDVESAPPSPHHTKVDGMKLFKLTCYCNQINKVNIIINFNIALIGILN